MNLDAPHRRFNPLTRDWVLVSPHRARRPWLGQVEKLAREVLPAYDPACYLCPGNERAGGVRNPAYASTFVFDNDFAALLPDPGPEVEGSHPLLTIEPEVGACRVVCFSPRHDLGLPQLPLAAVEAVITTWTGQTVELGSRANIRYVQIFENKGAMMGCSNPHPHSQVWATGQIPNEAARELAAQAAYLDEHGSCLLCDYGSAERQDGSRIVCANQHFTALVPFWAVWPFEVLLLPHRHAASLPDLDPAERTALADIIRRLTARYDNLFEIPFPYSMGFHQAPTDGRGCPGQHLHAHFYPPLLRSATVRKFMVGYEMLAMPQRDITPETAAERLRGLSEVHFLGGDGQ
ncbi:MAG: UDP-glucose--hexose-1-phosphate uridylyltransferase [Anaerolineales bacterium]|nr:UDP-glucose--hexose-1-phosphate uridylyltransferase [Anaerolineales bacterium]